MIAALTEFLTQRIAEFAQANRSYLTIAVGCTGGQHRSVYIAEQLAEHFRESYPQVLTRHDSLQNKTRWTAQAAEPRTLDIAAHARARGMRGSRGAGPRIALAQGDQLARVAALEQQVAQQLRCPRCCWRRCAQQRAQAARQLRADAGARFRSNPATG